MTDRIRRRLLQSGALAGAFPGTLAVTLAGAWPVRGAAATEPATTASGNRSRAGGLRRRELPTDGSHAFTAQVGDTSGAVPVNRNLLGQNLQWVDRGDDLFDLEGQPDPHMLEQVRRLAPSGLRFPGGAQSDVYRWRRGIGPLATRPANLHFHSRQDQPSVIGTIEFLELCERLGAAPLITVNVVTGTPEEAAEWVAFTNGQTLISRATGRPLPRVTYWEIGNEPYLQEGDRSLWLRPGDYVERANRFIRALRDADASVRIGIPLRTDTLGGAPATPYPGFAREVLQGVVERFDFLCLHNAYMPYAPAGIPDDDTLYWATVGAAASVAENLRQVRALTSELAGPGRGWQGASPPMAITEYNGLYTLGRGASDDLIASPLTGLYLADLLQTLSQEPDLLFAHFWSLSGNWLFGSIAGDGSERPAFHVLRLYERVLRGIRLPLTLSGERFDAPALGTAAAGVDQALVTGMATFEQGVLRLLLINKDRHRPAVGRIVLPGSPVVDAALVSLVAASPGQITRPDSSMVEHESTGQVGVDGSGITLAPASITLVKVLWPEAEFPGPPALRARRKPI